MIRSQHKRANRRGFDRKEHHRVLVRRTVRETSNAMQDTVAGCSFMAPRSFQIALSAWCCAAAGEGQIRADSAEQPTAAAHRSFFLHTTKDFKVTVRYARVINLKTHLSRETRARLNSPTLMMIHCSLRPDLWAAGASHHQSTGRHERGCNLILTSHHGHHGHAAQPPPPYQMPESIARNHHCAAISQRILVHPPTLGYMFTNLSLRRMNPQRHNTGT